MKTITLDKAYLSVKPDFEWLETKIHSSFSLTIGDKSKIVFGFNGIGKSSLANALRGDMSVSFRFLDYERDERESIDGVQKELTIAPSVLDMAQIEEDISKKRKAIAFDDLVKSSGFKKTGSTDPDFIKQLRKDLKASQYQVKLLTDDSSYNAFLVANPGTKPETFFVIANGLAHVSSARTELNNALTEKYLLFLESAEGFVQSDNRCPVCDTAFADVKAVINTKIQSIAAAESSLIRLMDSKKIPYDEKTINAYLKLYRYLESHPEILNDYVLCGNESLRHTSLAKELADIASLESRLNLLKKKKQQFYCELKNVEDRFIRDVEGYLKLPTGSVVFNDTTLDISVSLGREVTTFSTGERHILWFLCQLYSFLGSDSDVLVLDDPASSLDLINMYKIAFEIVKTSNKKDKTLLLFTHSADLVNAINSQKPGAMEIYYIEELGGSLYCEKVCYAADSQANVFTCERLRNYSPKLIDSMLARETDGPDSFEHLVYHYEPGAPHTSRCDPLLSNSLLVALIESFSGFTLSDFYNNTFTKIHHLLALRVWLEKQLFLLIPSSDDNVKDQFLGARSLHGKIGIALQASGKPPDEIEKMREAILSKKVMLNQNAHIYSQVSPFAYAMNISFDQLHAEIHALKDLFCGWPSTR